MAASSIEDDLPWSLDEWLVIDVDEQATDHAIEILEESGPDRRVSVKRVLEYARGERPARAIKSNDWTRVLEHTDGRLALVSWSSGGVTEIGLKDDPDQRRAYDVWMFSALREREMTDDASSAGVSDLLRGSSPAIVPVWESHLRPDIVADGGQSTGGTERFCWHVVRTNGEGIAYDSHLSFAEAAETVQLANETTEYQFSLKGVPDCSLCTDTDRSGGGER